MSNETRGELAEAIAVVGLTQTAHSRRQTVFWEERQLGALVLPDITVGMDPCTPTHVVLVTACDTPRSSAMKYWRDLGELFDAKSNATPPPRVISLVFRSSIKEELIRLESALCDAALLVDRSPRFGEQIAAWLEENHGDAPSKKEGKRSLVEDALKRASKSYDPDFASAMRLFSQELEGCLDANKSALAPLWKLCRADTQNLQSREVRQPKNTLFRRGIARWAVLEDADRNRIFETHIRRRTLPASEAPEYAIQLGMLSKRIGGYGLRAGGNEQDMLATVGEDMRKGAEFFLTAASGDPAKALAGFKASIGDVPDFMRTVAVQLRATPAAVRSWHEFSQENWASIIEPDGLYGLLMKCYEDDTLCGRVKRGGTGRVWLYDHCVAILRAASGRSNDFGYGPLGSLFQRERNTREFQSLQKQVISMLAPKDRAGAARWMKTTLEKSSEPGRRGFQEWLAKTKKVSAVVIASYAYSLSKMLKSIVGSKNIVDLDKVIAAHAYALWNKLLTYPEFEGLPGLVLAGCGSLVSWGSVPTLMAEIAGETVQDAGVLRMLAFDGGLVFWVSATDAGRGHKVKELSAKARCLRHQYVKGRFSRRPTAQRLFLVVDGTFTVDDLAALKNAGWDGLFYPDEIGQLAAAIRAK